jgi:hypothetical protein
MNLQLNSSKKPDFKHTVATIKVQSYAPINLYNRQHECRYPNGYLKNILYALHCIM